MRKTGKYDTMKVGSVPPSEDDEEVRPIPE
jgi:hypothetical protein